MKLITHNQLNREYFRAGNRPTRKFWADTIEEGTVNGKIICGRVYVDVDDFLSRNNLDKDQAPANDDGIPDIYAML